MKMADLKNPKMHDTTIRNMTADEIAQAGKKPSRQVRRAYARKLAKGQEA